MTLAQMFNNIKISTDVLIVVAGENVDYSWMDNETYWMVDNWENTLECEATPPIPDTIMNSIVTEMFVFPSALYHVDNTLVLFVSPDGFNAERYWKEIKEERNANKYGIE